MGQTLKLPALTPAQIRTYKEAGFVIVTDVFPADELKEIDQEIGRVAPQLDVAAVVDGDDARRGAVDHESG